MHQPATGTRLGDEADESAGRRVLDRIAHEVADRLREAVGIAVQLATGRARELEAPVGRDPVRLVEPVEPWRDRDRLLPQPATLLGLREQQQVLDEPLHALDLDPYEALDPLHVARLDVRLAGEHLELAADDRQRRAQLVRSVGDEVTLAVERALEPVEHVVERVGERPDLVARARPRRSGREVAGVDLARREAIRRSGPGDPRRDEDAGRAAPATERERAREDEACAPRRAGRARPAPAARRRRSSRPGYPWPTQRDRVQAQSPDSASSSVGSRPGAERTQRGLVGSSRCSAGVSSDSLPRGRAARAVGDRPPPRKLCDQQPDRGPNGWAASTRRAAKPSSGAPAVRRAQAAGTRGGPASSVDLVAQVAVRRSPRRRTEPVPATVTSTSAAAASVSRRSRQARRRAAPGHPGLRPPSVNR